MTQTFKMPSVIQFLASSLVLFQLGQSLSLENWSLSEEEVSVLKQKINNGQGRLHRLFNDYKVKKKFQALKTDPEVSMNVVRV